MASALQLALREEQALWEETSLPKNDGWTTSSPKDEARGLFRLLASGESLADLRRLISVSPAEEAELRLWAASSAAALATKIDRMLRYRRAVLDAFDALVARQRAKALHV